MRTDVTTERATVNVQSVVLFNKCYSKCYTPSINCKYVSYMHEYGPGAMGAARAAPRCHYSVIEHAPTVSARELATGRRRQILDVTRIQCYVLTSKVNINE